MSLIPQHPRAAPLIAPDGRRCDLCDGRNFELVSERDRRKQPLATVVCRTCGLVSHREIPTDRQLEQFYASAYRQQYQGELTPTPRRVLRAWKNGERVFAQLQPFLQPGQAVFEVGAGIGCTLKVFELHGHPAAGIEPHHGFRRYGANQLQVQLSGGYLFELAPQASRELVLLIHVIEHFNSPRKALEHLHRLILPDGRLYVECPNLAAPFAARQRLFHFAHIHNFTPLTLQMLARRCGFELESCFSMPRDPNLQMLFRRTPRAKLRIDAASYPLTRDALQRAHPLTYHLRWNYVWPRVRKLSSYLGEHLLGQRHVTRLLRRCGQQPSVAVAPATAASRQQDSPTPQLSLVHPGRKPSVMTKTALITGITGQDGSYLAEFLLEKGYEVHGVVRRSSGDNLQRIHHLLDRVTLHPADLLDLSSLVRLLDQVRPREVYNLAAQSFVPTSWSQPVLTAELTAVGVTRLLEAVRLVDTSIRFYQASSSEMFGRVQETPQSERTPFWPRSPYGVAKVYGHWITVNYRESYDLFACSGILFNHESPRRGREFVTRKISHTVAQIKLGLADQLRLGNLRAQRDWGFAGDYVEAMWLMLQQDQPDDFVVGTGHTYHVQDFVETAFRQVGLNWRDYVVVDPQFYRPAEVDLLIADPTKARTMLAWQPKVGFEQLVNRMVDADLASLSQAAPAAPRKAA